MAAAESDEAREGWEPPFLLSWKGLQSWSVGCRAPSICEMFVGLNRKKLGKLINGHGFSSKLTKNTKKKKACGAKGRSSIRDVDKEKLECDRDDVERKLGLSSWVPARRSCSAICDQPPNRLCNSSSEVRRHSFQWRRSCDGTWVPRRNSDASASSFSAPLHLLSACSGGYGVFEGSDVGPEEYILPPTGGVKLGGRICSRRSDASSSCTAELSRQDSGVSSCNRRSSSFSATEVAKKAGGRLGRRSGAAATAAALFLQGNQCLTHLTAAPLPTTSGHHRRYAPHTHPSGGLLLDASLRCREDEMKDRIIFFL